MFYDKFIAICSEKGVSPSRLLTSLGLSKGALSNWKKGAEPINETKKKIADSLGITMSELDHGKTKQPDSINADGLSDIDKRIYRLWDTMTEAEKLQTLAYAQGLTSTRKD